MIFFAVLVAAIAALAWIRFAPSDPVRWHVDPQVTADQDLATGVRRRIPLGQDALSTLHGIILSTPRTEVLAGSLEEGRVTYVTRTLWLGFPDYTTVQMDDSQIELWARQRFGQSDQGVNRARVEDWLSQLAVAQDKG